MEKMVIDSSKILKRLKVISGEMKSAIYEYDNNHVLKIFNPLTILELKLLGEDKERKILTANPMEDVPEILIPSKAVYDVSGLFLGYLMKRAKGIDFVSYEHSLKTSQIVDLKRFAIEYKKLEDMVKRAHQHGIVFPDLCTCDNIFIDKSGNYQMIDYDDLQIGEQISSVISTELGVLSDNEVPKYKDQNTGLYTEELDIKSLIFLYFLHTFNIRLSSVGRPISGTNRTIDLDLIFNQINFYDYDIMNKVWKCLQSTGKNEYLGDDVFRIAEKYDMSAQRIPGTYMYYKELRRK